MPADFPAQFFDVQFRKRVRPVPEKVPRFTEIVARVTLAPAKAPTVREKVHLVPERVQQVPEKFFRSSQKVQRVGEEKFVEFPTQFFGRRLVPKKFG